jgi:hypothetical protein
LTGCRKEDEVVATCISDVIVGKIIQGEGEIKLIGSSWVIDVSNTGGRYFACNFPEEYQVENKIIIFDADVYQIPPNMRLVGTPIIITHIYE